MTTRIKQKKQISKYFFLALLFLLITSCVTTRRTNYLQKPDLIIPSYPQDTNRVDDYHLIVGDELSITIYSLEEEANTLFNSRNSSSQVGFNSSKEKSIYTYTVLSDGSIDFPVLGKIFVLGKTLRETSIYLKSLLKNRFIINDFSVVVDLVNNNFSVISETGSGKYPIVKEHMNIFQAIACSQDLSTFADRAHVKIIRQTSEGTIIKEFDIRSKDLLYSEFYYIQPNDVIYIQSFKGQFFRFDSFSGVFSVIVTTVTLGLFVFKLSGF